MTTAIVRRVAAATAGALLLLAPLAVCAQAPDTKDTKGPTTKEAPAKKKKKPAAPDKAPDAAKQAAPSRGSKTPLADEEYGPQLPPPPPDNVVVAAPKREPIGRGRGIIGVGLGPVIPEVLSSFGPYLALGVELGWALPKLPAVGEGFAVTLNLDYSLTAPSASGTAIDPHPPADMFAWSVSQKNLSLGFTILYRAGFVMNGRLVPYLGIGPRLFVLETTASAQPGMGTTQPYTETSTRGGFAVPLGVDYALWKGRLFLQAIFLYAPSNQNTTGPSNAGGLAIELGYRFLFGLGG